MKKRAFHEITEKSTQELKKLVAEEKKAMSLSTLDVGSGKSKQTSLRQKKRKDIAQLLTILRARELN